MSYTKQDVIKLLSTMPDDSFNIQHLIEELGYRLTIQTRLKEAEQGLNCISNEEARTRFVKWLQD